MSGKSNHRARIPEGILILLVAFSVCVLTISIFSHQESSGLSFLLDVSATGSSVDGHFLFETIITAVVEAGDEIVRMKNEEIKSGEVNDAPGSSSGGQFFGKYPDGSKELHTRADAMSHKMIGRVREVFPGITVVDEEDASGEWRKPQPLQRVSPRLKNVGKDEVVSASRLFNLRGKSSLPLAELALFVDPLDATLEYSEGLTEFVSVSACVTRCGRPIAGVVYFPFNKRIYWSRAHSDVHVNFDAQTAISAERSVSADWELEGKSSSGNVDSNTCCENGKSDRRASLSDSRSVSGSLEAIDEWDRGIRVIGSRSRKSKNASLANVVDLIDSLVERRRREDQSGGQSLDATYLKAGGAAFKIVELVEGRADAYLHPNKIRKWDLCASEVLLKSKGGQISSWGGNEVDYCVYERRQDKESIEDVEQFVVEGVVAASGPLLHHDIFKGIKG